MYLIALLRFLYTQLSKPAPRMPLKIAYLLAIQGSFLIRVTPCDLHLRYYPA